MHNLYDNYSELLSGKEKPAMPKCCDDSRILNWGSVLGQMFLKSHQIPNFEKYETRASYLKKDIGLGPTLFPRVHSGFKIRFGIINIAQS